MPGQNYDKLCELNFRNFFVEMLTVYQENVNIIGTRVYSDNLLKTQEIHYSCELTLHYSLVYSMIHALRFLKFENFQHLKVQTQL